MIDKKQIGLEFDPVVVDVEAGRLRFFAKVIGETNPVYFDVEAAKAAGYRNIPSMPTMPFCLEMDGPDPFGFLAALEINIVKILHGEQEFVYHHAVCAGDTLTFKSKITDIYDKKGGALEFVVQKFDITNQDNALVVEMTRTIVVRN